jgi:hypothetical protein
LGADADDPDQGDFDEQGVDREHRATLCEDSEKRPEKETARSPG